MTNRESTSRLFCLLCGILALGIAFFLVSLVWLTAEGSASPNEASQPGFERQNEGAVRLPNRMDPTDVVRMVRSNRWGAAENSTIPTYTQSLDAVVRTPTRPVDEVGLPFQIGVGSGNRHV